jgi:signal recognition particle receptor subunit alpha
VFSSSSLKSHPLTLRSSEATPKKKSKAKAQRKWGDQAPTESEMATLDFSMDKPNDAHGKLDLQALVDQSSLGTRTGDGMYEVKDWEFGADKDANDAIANALKPLDSSKPKSTIGSLFARLTGSKVLTQEDLKPVLDAMKQHLMKKNVAMDIAEKVCEGVGETLVGQKVGGFQSTYNRSPRCVATEFLQLPMLLSSSRCPTP